MPRKIDSRSATTTRFGIPSAKNDGMIPVESTLEAAQALRLEFAPSVSAYESQPRLMACGTPLF